jgi:hypothetical protein
VVGDHGAHWVALAACCAWLLPRAAAAQEPEDFGSGVEIHGFVSQGFIKTTDNNYLAESERGSFEFSEVGLNFTKQVTDELRLGVQLFAHELGPFGNYAPQVDWYYLDYRLWDWLGLRVGHTKMPYGLYNEINDIDVARVPVLLPQSIYPADHREFLVAQTGAEIYGDVPLGPAGVLEYRAYGGTLFSALPDDSAPGVSVEKVATRYVFGGRALWYPPLFGLRAGVSGQALRLDSEYGLTPDLLAVLQAIALVPADLPVPVPVKFRVKRWVASLQYATHDLDLSAEYSRLTGDFESPMPLLLPPHTVNERYVVMASYRVSSWFTPGLYYSVYYPNVENRRGRESHQHDLAVTVRYDLNLNWLLKLEGHYLRGTAALDNRSLRDGLEQSELSPTWGMLIVKTTAYF